MNGAEALVRTLQACDIDICFTNPGTSEMHFVAALDRLDKLYCVLALQENVATGAADGYARMTGKPAATLLHLGPGFGNGLANIHNAKKAHTPMVNIVGDHATYHIKFDAPLTADVEGIARPVSHWVKTSEKADDVGPDAAKAVRAAKTYPGQIATLILPADASWSPTDFVGDHVISDAPAFTSDAAVQEAAKALTDGRKAMIFMTGDALVEPGLTLAGKVQAATGADLWAKTSNRRIDRGAGRVKVGKLPYPVDQAVEVLKDYEVIILLGTTQPVGFFAYPGKPSKLAPETADIVTLADPKTHVLDALKRLVAELDADAAEPTVSAAIDPVNEADVAGEITPEIISKALCAVMPDDAIVVDESITTGRTFFPDTFGAPPHTWLQITGGAIGDGLPLALGAGMACPERQVIVLQSDGSAMYTNQALWSMAREGCDILVLLFSNRTYKILELEMSNTAAVDTPGPIAQGLFSLSEPDIDWVKMSESMGVKAERVSDASGLIPAMRRGIEREGPYLVEIDVPPS